MQLKILLPAYCLLTIASFGQVKTNSVNTNWSPEQCLKLKNITAVRVSPDGNKVVYTVREAVMTDDRSEYVAFPRQPHGLQEPRMVLKAMQANVDWFEKYIGDKKGF